jgi:hypothetical protein
VRPSTTDGYLRATEGAGETARKHAVETSGELTEPTAPGTRHRSGLAGHAGSSGRTGAAA